MRDVVIDEFIRGVNDYWSGELPLNWNNREARENSPYLTGWYMASLWETQPGTLIDDDLNPLQED